MTAEPGRAATAPSRTSLRVLIVGDSEEDARRLARELARGGYAPAHERVDSPEALRRMLAAGGAWDAVLAAWRLPRFGALEALGLLRAAGSDAPLIVVAGEIGAAAAAAALRAGAHDYVPRDDLARLGAAVGRGIAEAGARRARDRARRRLEERMASLARISASLCVGQPVEMGLDDLAARVRPNTAAVACSVVLIDSETGLLRAVGAHGLPDGYVAGLQAAYQSGVRSRALEVYRTRRPLLARDARRSGLDNPLFAPIHRFLRAAAWDTIYFVPLVVDGQAIGALNLYYPAGQEPDEEEIVFLGAVADQAAVAVEHARLLAEARGRAALEERQRLARELHDSVAQALYSIALEARTARALFARGEPGRADGRLGRVLALAEAGLAEMRALIFELRPESLAAEGLVAALEHQAAALRARHELAIDATLGAEPDLPLETKEALYRIAQEALHNIVKHARASRVALTLACDARGVTLEVADDGRGFDPRGAFAGHLGLTSMRERAARLGGALRVESAPGNGARISARIPRGA